jgi:succinate-acetate transporter protein
MGLGISQNESAMPDAAQNLQMAQEEWAGTGVSPRANPAPLGLAAFGVTTTVLSVVNAGLLSADAVSAVVPLAFAFGGVVQFLAGMLEFRNGNTFGTVAFTSYGAFWWWYALLSWAVGAGWMKQPGADGVGVALLAWGLFTFYMWIATFRLNTTLWIVFLLAWVTIFLLAGGALGLGTPLTKWGGWSGLFCGLGAQYGSFAEIMNATCGKVVISLGPPLWTPANRKN